MKSWIKHGAIPAAILSQLDSKNDLGLHGGLLDDGGMGLIQQGNATGLMKPIDQGLHITGMALGGPALLDWLADTPTVIFRGADHTHEVSVIRQLSNFVSVNSAVEVDLFGQVNAEYAALAEARDNTSKTAIALWNGKTLRPNKAKWWLVPPEGSLTASVLISQRGRSTGIMV